MGRSGRILAGLVAVAALAGCNAAEERGGARGTVGYTVVPPEGWQDITRSVAETTKQSFDVAYGGPIVDGVRVNLNITHRDAGNDPSLGRLVRDGKREVDELGGGDLKFSRAVRTQIDGAPALRYDFATNGRRVRQVGALHGDDYYVVTLTAPSSGFRDAARRLDEVLRSWRWDR